MFIHKDLRFTIYFGDAQESITLGEIAEQQSTPALQNIAQQVRAEQVAFLHQTHGVDGMEVACDDDQNYFFQHDGDYLFTQKKNCGIGVVTADCLPIVIYDPVTHTSGIVHAGWKGLVAGILSVAIGDIVAKTGQEVSLFEIYLGPAGRPCCYEVQQDFIDKFAEYRENHHDFFIKRDGRTYFDSTAFIIVIARSLGIKREKIYTRYNVCTICNLSFCSYRREQEKARRQVTMICLH